MSKRLQVNESKSNANQKDSEQVVSVKSQSSSQDTVKKAFETNMQSVIKGLDEGKNKTMDPDFVHHVFETTYMGKLYAQMSGKSVNVPDISFDEKGLLQVDMAKYDPKEDVLEQSKDKRKQLTAQPVKEQDGYQDVLKDSISRNPISGMVRSAKSLRQGETGDAAKSLLESIPVINAAKTIQHGVSVHKSRVEEAEALQKRVMTATGMGAEKSAGLEF